MYKEQTLAQFRMGCKDSKPLSAAPPVPFLLKLALQFLETSLTASDVKFNVVVSGENHYTDRSVQLKNMNSSSITRDIEMKSKHGAKVIERG